MQQLTQGHTGWEAAELGLEPRASTSEPMLFPVKCDTVPLLEELAVKMRWIHRKRHKSIRLSIKSEWYFHRLPSIIASLA